MIFLWEILGIVWESSEGIEWKIQAIVHLHCTSVICVSFARAFGTRTGGSQYQFLLQAWDHSSSFECPPNVHEPMNLIYVPRARFNLHLPIKRIKYGLSFVRKRKRSRVKGDMRCRSVYILLVSFSPSFALSKSPLCCQTQYHALTFSQPAIVGWKVRHQVKCV